MKLLDRKVIKLIYCIDSSAVLNGALSFYAPQYTYLSPLVLMELEKIKSSNNETIKYKARQAVRTILNTNTIITTIPRKAILKIFKAHPFLMDINDHYILCEAFYLNKYNAIEFVTSDAAQLIFARELGLKTTYFPDENSRSKSEEYKGWKKVNPTEAQLAELYSNLENNIFDAKINEFIEIYENNVLKDILFWDGNRYNNLKYQTFKGCLGEKIAPRNLEQKMLFHLLQNDDIKVKLCLGGFGDGKTWSMLQHALKGVKEGQFSKIIYVRNNIITKGSRDIGYLSGSLIDKIKPYILPIADLTTPEYLDELIETGILEPVPLAFMRGRDFSGNILVFCDEAENLTQQNIQLLIGRIGEGSQLWLAGDLKQIDHYDFEKNNGIKRMIECLSNEKLFGMVHLIKSERSRTSQLADLMD